jgi:hypothetical protein
MTPERSEKLRRTAIDSKNRIVEEIREIDNFEQLMMKCAMIGSALDVTQGLWAELGYAYKAKEILEMLLVKLSILESNVSNIAEIIQAKFARSIIETQIDEFYHLQQERMSKDASLN